MLGKRIYHIQFLIDAHPAPRSCSHTHHASHLTQKNSNHIHSLCYLSYAAGGSAIITFHPCGVSSVPCRALFSYPIVSSSHYTFQTSPSTLACGHTAGKLSIHAVLPPLSVLGLGWGIWICSAVSSLTPAVIPARTRGEACGYLADRRETHCTSSSAPSVDGVEDLNFPLRSCFSSICCLLFAYRCIMHLYHTPRVLYIGID